MSPKENADIESTQSSICPVTGLPVLSKPEWSDVSYGKNYRLTLSIVGDGILWSQPSGYVTLYDLENAFTLNNKVVTEAIAGGRPYVQIEDVSNIQSISPEARRFYVDYMKKREWLGGLIFYGASPMFKMIIKLGKRLNIVQVNVELVNNYSEAVSLALKILSNGETQIDDSPVLVAPLPPVISEKPEKESEVCHVTGLPVTTRPEWTDIDLGGGYSVTFKFIGDRILHSFSRGRADGQAMKRLFQERAKVLDAMLGPDESFFELRDFSGVRGKPSKKARDEVVRGLTVDKERMIGYLGYNAPLVIRLAMDVGQRLHKSPFPMVIVKDYEMAIKKAVDALKHHEEMSKSVKPLPRLAVIDSEGEPLASDQIQRYVGDLLHFVGNINWETDGLAYDSGKVDPSHPFSPVFDAISLIKADIDDLFEERRKSEERYRLLVDNANDMVYIHDINGRFSFVNQSTIETFGYSREELLGMRVSDLVDPRHFPNVVSGMKDRIKGIKPADLPYEFLCRDKNGGEIWIETSIRFIYEGDRIAGIQGIARNITEYKKSQRELKESEEKYRNILENIEDGYYEDDLKGTFTFFNDALCGIFGYSRDELMGMSSRDYTDEETFKKVYQAYNEVYRTGAPMKGFSWEISRKDREKRYLEASASLIKNAEGKPIGFRGIMRDITRRKQAEDAVRRYSEHLEDMVAERTENLKRSEEKYRTILENIEDGYYEVDLPGNLTFFNDSLCEILGYPRDELMGMSNQEYAGEESAKRLYREFNKVYKTGAAAKRIDCEVITKDREKRFVETSVSLIRNSKGKPVGFRGIVRDVTARIRLEHELMRKRRQAEEASRAKSEFLANMSHEIRTPLNGIIGMAELAMDTDIDDNQKNILHTINVEASSLFSIVNEVLDFSKIEVGKLELEEIPFDLRVMIDDLSGSIALKAEQKGLEVISFLSPDVPARLMGDPGRLRQILVNLADNALKFTQKGEIYMGGEMVEDLGDRVKVRFLVKDTGIGIPKDKQAKIFESFTQADGSTTREYGGTGLGTTISKQLAELMGGEIGVESEEGRGSAFWFTAVFARQGEQQVIPTGEEIDLGGLRVLAVDDNPTSRGTLMEYLRSWGCLPVEASGGKEALSILRKSVSSKYPFNLILTDIQMAGMGNFDLAGEIRKMDTLKGVPIVVLTSAGMRGDGKICKEIGIEGYLLKPVRRDDLHRVIVSVLGLSMREAAQTAPELVTRHTIAEEYGKDVHILLVEDYPTNQQVAMRHLGSAGYHVDLAEDGRQAVEAYRRNRYDLILMDIQMPVMDGYETTRGIRNLEFENRKPDESELRTPIIAMTAHAMKGDRERCLEAGMDDYITKPLRRKELLTVVDRWAGSVSEIGKRKTENEGRKSDNGQRLTENEPNVPMDFERVVDEFEGDREFLMEVAEGFLENVRAQIGTIRRAISDEDAEVIKREAHSIKGGAANLTADDLSGTAHELENIGKSENLEKAAETLERLEKEFYRLETHIKECSTRL